MGGQKADNGPSQAAGSKFVKFSRASAQRIAKVVRQVEGGNRQQSGVVFDHPMPSGAVVAIRTATFTGSWVIGEEKLVTFKYRSGTANAYNDLIDLPEANSRDCIVGKEGTAWRLINWQWYVIGAATAATLTTTELRFDTLPFGAVATSSTNSFVVSVIACSTATT